MKTDFIACGNFSGRHTHIKVAEKLAGIFDRYGIKEKVHFVTTDGAGEYTAAFKYYGDNYDSICFRDEHTSNDDASVTDARGEKVQQIADMAVAGPSNSTVVAVRAVQ